MVSQSFLSLEVEIEDDGVKRRNNSLDKDDPAPNAIPSIKVLGKEDDGFGNEALGGGGMIAFVYNGGDFLVELFLK